MLHQVILDGANGHLEEAAPSSLSTTVLPSKGMP